VTDTTTGNQKQYVSFLGTKYRQVQDTEAFDCP
jgi:hypothetical protein